MHKLLIISYFRSVSFPLAEATRIQLINHRESALNILFWRSWKLKRVRRTILLPIPFVIVILPFLLLIPRKFQRTYGPLDSRFINLLNAVLRCNHIITEVSDYHLVYKNNGRRYEKFNSPVIDDTFLKYSVHSRKKGVFRILFMSHFSKRKGLDVLLKALLSTNPTTQKNIELTLCDSGIVASDISNQTLYDFEKNFGGTVYFKGVVDPNAELNQNDIYVYPFVKPEDTFIIPMSFLEAVCAYVVPVGPNFEFVENWLPEEFTCEPSAFELKLKLEDVIRNYESYYVATQILRKEILSKIHTGQVQRSA